MARVARTRRLYAKMSRDFASIVAGDSPGEEIRKQRGHLLEVDLASARQASPDRRAVNRTRLLVAPEEHRYSAD